MIHRFEFRAMGCQMSAALDSPKSNAGQKLERLPTWFNDWENCLSRFRVDSELNALNRNAGKQVQVSDTFWEVFEAARSACQGSNGLVTPAVLNALERAGYDRSWEMMTRAGNLTPEYLPLPIPDLEKIEQDITSRTIRLPSGVHLDFGGIAKGWAAHQAMRRLQLYGPTLVNAGGDIAISGLQSSGQPWPVGVIDPFRPEVDLELLQVGRCGIATSGRDFRRWRSGEIWQHHIIDPRTGFPAESDVLSVTIVAPTVLEAEMAAKTVLILGSYAGLDWLESRPGLAGLLVMEHGKKSFSRRMESYLWR